MVISWRWASSPCWCARASRAQAASCAGHFPTFLCPRHPACLQAANICDHCHSECGSGFLNCCRSCLPLRGARPACMACAMSAAQPFRPPIALTPMSALFPHPRSRFWRVPRQVQEVQRAQLLRMLVQRQPLRGELAAGDAARLGAWHALSWAARPRLAARPQID